MLALIYEALVGLFTFFRLFLINFFPKLKLFLMLVIPYALADIVKLLGVGVVTFTGFKIILNQLQGFIITKLGSIAAPLLNILFLCGVDTIVSMYFATFAIIATIKVTTGASSKLVWNKPHGTSNTMDA